MKSFKQHINEKWLQTFYSQWDRDEFADIFLNPSRKEIAQMNKRTYNSNKSIWGEGFRAFLMDNGDMYAWDKGLHNEVYKKLLNGRKDFIPITIYIKGGMAHISVSTYVSGSNHKGDLDQAIYDVGEHKQIKRLFGNKIDLDDSGYSS